MKAAPNGTYSYSSGLRDGKADVFVQTLLGKDYYLFDIKTFDPYMLSVDNDFENIVFSIKDPYHVTNGTISGVPPDSPDSFSVSASWKYQLNGENNVTNMTFKGASETHVYTLK